MREILCWPGSRKTGLFSCCQEKKLARIRCGGFTQFKHIRGMEGHSSWPEIPCLENNCSREMVKISQYEVSSCSSNKENRQKRLQVINIRVNHTCPKVIQQNIHDIKAKAAIIKISLQQLFMDKLKNIKIKSLGCSGSSPLLIFERLYFLYKCECI